MSIVFSSIGISWPVQYYLVVDTVDKSAFQRRRILLYCYKWIFAEQTLLLKVLCETDANISMQVQL